MKPLPQSKITPLWIIASFLSFTEVILGYAVTQTSGGVQIALTAFVILFPLLVAVAFFSILWFKAGVFYPPSEYGDTDPAKYMSAMQGLPSLMFQVENVKRVEADPEDTDAKFSLIYSMSDKLDWQFVILMHEKQVEVPKSSPYVYEFPDGSSGTGQLSVLSDPFRLEGTGIVDVTGGGTEIRLTKEGEEFARWWIKKGKKASFFWTPSGHWGKPTEGGSSADYLRQKGIELT